MKTFKLLFLIATAALCADDCNCEKPPAPAKQAIKIPDVPNLVPLSLGDCGKITWKPGLRIQTRYTYDQETHKNDIFIPRLRLKCGGDAFEICKYYAEVRFDNFGRFRVDPRVEIENAWLDFMLCKQWAYLRVGFYDLPFSRDALTSDAKLLFMDRSLIKDTLTSLGLADNTIGVMLHGRPDEGHFEYAFGIFDNFKFDGNTISGFRETKQLMPAGRLVWNLMDPAEPPEGYADYLASYIGKGHRLNIGINGAYVGGCHDAEDNKFEMYAWGADLFYNWGPYTFQAEYDWFHQDFSGYGWYAQAGYLFWTCLEFAVRYQQLEPDKDSRHDRLDWTTIGLNWYLREHNLKMQTEYVFKREEGYRVHNNLFQIQVQLDF